MNIFTMDTKLWGVIPFNGGYDVTLRQEEFNKSELAKFYNFSGATYDDKISPLLTKYNGVSVSLQQASNPQNIVFTLPGFEKVSISFDADPRYYFALADNVSIFGFGSADKIYGYHAFIDGKTADVTESDEKILVVRIKYDEVDKTYIYTSNRTGGTELTSDFGNVMSRGFCDKFLLTPLAYKGIAACGAYVADGGMSELSEGVCKIDDSYFYKIDKNIVVNVDRLVK